MFGTCAHRALTRPPWRFTSQIFSLQQQQQQQIRHLHTCLCLTNSSSSRRVKKSDQKKIKTSHKNWSQKSAAPIHDLWVGINVKRIATLLKLNVDDVFEFLISCNDSECIRNEFTPIHNFRLLNELAHKLKVRIRLVPDPSKQVVKEEVNLDVVVTPPDPKDLIPRAPVVAIMGHVDHGKTTLLDHLRKSKIVDGEFGGITQHIGAFSVTLDQRKQGDNRVTFIDTPGHAAFKAMRSRGAKSTDIVVLVVDASEGVLEQTLESIRMIKASGAPMVVALNKIDRPKADIERTKKELDEAGVKLEDFGGDVQAVPISALKGTNIDSLIEALLIQAELLQLKSVPQGMVQGIVIESNVQDGFGKCATVLVQRGTLVKGNYLVSGTAQVKVRAMLDDRGKQLTRVGPSEAAKIVGWKAVPSAGDAVDQVPNEKRSNEVIKWREKQEAKFRELKVAEVVEQKRAEDRVAYDEMRELKAKLGRRKLRIGLELTRVKESKEYTGPPKLPLVIKTDVDGSLEAILNCLDTYDDDESVVLDLIDFGVGEVTQNDVTIAEQFDGTVLAFNCKVPKDKMKLAQSLGVDIQEFNIIYKLVDHLKEMVNERMPEIDVEEMTGRGIVLQEFEINVGRKKAPVAGVRVKEGKISRNENVKVVRGETILYKGPLASLKHHKEEVKEIAQGTECGLMVTDREVRFQNDDIIYCFHLKKEKSKTKWDPGF